MEKLKIKKYQYTLSVGIITQLSPAKKQLLTEKSILDVYRDLVYFPKVTKIIGAFVRGAISKPHPDKLHEEFDELP